MRCAAARPAGRPERCDDRGMPADDRFARQRLLPELAGDGQRRLGAARVVVVGAGGLGCALLPALVAAGVGHITVVDEDVVEVTNLHRQTLYGLADVGAGKAEAAVRALDRIRPERSVVTARRMRVDPETASDVVAVATVVVDATDSSAARTALDAATERARIPLVWGAALGFTGQVGVTAEGARWRDLFPGGTEDGDTCATVGVLPTVPATIGALMATEVLKLAAGFGRPLTGRILAIDARTAAVREIAYRKDPTVTETPAATAPLPDLQVTELADLLEDGADVQLVDVREPWEAEIATIPGAVLIPLGEITDRSGDLDPSRTVVLYCHAGVRSASAARKLALAGFTTQSVAGGIDAWSRIVDPSVERY